MWPFKRRERWVIFQVNTGLYYAGNEKGHLAWTPVKRFAMTFTKDGATDIKIATAISPLDYGTLVILEK